MFKIIYPSADATLYESLSTYNTGLDEILEVGKRLSTSGSNLLTSRALIKFDMNDVTSALSKYSVNVNNCKFIIRFKTPRKIRIIIFIPIFLIRNKQILCKNT